MNIETLSKQLTETLNATDEAYQMYADARQRLADAKMRKYVETITTAGEVVFVPLEAMMEELKQQEVDSGNFVSQLNGRTTKEERAAELEAWMRQNVPEYTEYANRLQNQVVNEAIEQGAAQIAETNYGRLHTKIMALRGQIEFLTANANIEAERLSTEVAMRGVEVENMHSARLKREIELAKIQQETAWMQLEAAQMNVSEEVEKARKEMTAEVEQYKKAVQPLLDMARNLKALNIMDITE